MKTTRLLILFILLLSACNSNSEGEEIPLKNGIEKWELVRMTGSFINSETVGEAKEWQEYYLFNPNGTFFKSRKRDGVITQAMGTYEVMEEGDNRYYGLTYETGKSLIASCSGNDKEILFYDRGVLNATWNACDGPGLEYKLVSEKG